MSTNVKVKDAMITNVITGSQTETVQQIAIKMKEKDVGSIIICDDSKVVGIVTREDIVNKVVAENISSADLIVKEIMSLNVVSVEPDADLTDAAKTMTKYGFERLPVIKDGKLVGIISDREIAKISPSLIEILRERLMLEEDQGPEDEHIDRTSGICELCGNFYEDLQQIDGKWVCETCKEEAAEV
ncbi:MAG: CBS domain-containing protein [Candidatus Aenigmarchaeota archaeon]|nr:CBS domain-containing protein [Candidatus Aenigmarchaeota archaeon]